MSEHITHTALADDCFRLSVASPAICDPFREVAREQIDFGRLGAITRKGDLFTIDLLDRYRAQWPGAEGEERTALARRLAFVLGWLSHRAADRQMKPVFRAVEPGRDYSPAECSVYNDALVFHEVYGSGSEPPFHPAMFDPKLDALAGEAADRVPVVEELLRVALQRSLLELHTFIPEQSDVEQWMDRLFEAIQTFHVDRRRYAEAIANPDPAKVSRYLEGTNFYDRDEPIIAAARQLQRGERIADAELERALDADPASHYGQALRMGYAYIQAASDFFSSDQPAQALREALNIGQPGRDGVSV